MKRLLPPALFLLFALAMGLVCWAFDFHHTILFPYNLSGLPLLLGGIFLAQASKNLFITIKTNVQTFGEPDTLVTTGFYRFSRNPMYLGFVIAIFGVAVLYQGSLSSFVLAIIFIIITDRWYIRFEEEVMFKKFGSSYSDYTQSTRRWI